MPSMHDPTKYGAIIIKFDIMYPLYMPITKETCESFKDDL